MRAACVTCSTGGWYERLAERVSNTVHICTCIRKERDYGERALIFRKRTRPVPGNAAESKILGRFQGIRSTPPARIHTRWQSARTRDRLSIVKCAVTRELSSYRSRKMLSELINDLTSHKTPGVGCNYTTLPPYLRTCASNQF